MSDQELEKILNEMEQLFGNLPNPIQEPIRFKYYVRIWKYIKERRTE